MHSPVIVKLSITCGDDNLSKIIEPNVCVSSKRFEAINKLRESGIYTGVLMMPILPFINDTKDNIDKIINQAHKSGANFIYPMFGVTLRSNQRFYYYKKLRENFPNLVSKYQNLYGDKYICNSPNYKSLQQYFEQKCSELEITYKMEEIISEYKSKFKVSKYHLIYNL